MSAKAANVRDPLHADLEVVLQHGLHLPVRNFANKNSPGYGTQDARSNFEESWPRDRWAAFVTYHNIIGVVRRPHEGESDAEHRLAHELSDLLRPFGVFAGVLLNRHRHWGVLLSADDIIRLRTALIDE